MTDFLDRYGEQLQRAAPRRRRRVRFARFALPAVAVAAAAVIVVAASDRDLERPVVPSAAPTATPAPQRSGTWTPPVGRPEVGLHARIDRSPVASSAADVLAVLRRPQTARDRKLARPKLRYTGGSISGVQVDSVRALSPAYALVPVIKAGTGTAGNLCILGGGGGACAPAENVAERGVTLIGGGPKGTHYVGVVPDRVARVRFTPDGGAPAEVEVHENFYELRVGESSPPGRVNAPPGVKTGADGKIAGPGGPARGRLEWLDASGRVIGP